MTAQKNFIRQLQFIGTRSLAALMTLPLSLRRTILRRRFMREETCRDTVKKVSAPSDPRLLHDHLSETTLPSLTNFKPGGGGDYLIFYKIPADPGEISPDPDAFRPCQTPRRLWVSASCRYGISVLRSLLHILRRVSLIQRHVSLIQRHVSLTQRHVSLTQRHVSLTQRRVSPDGLRSPPGIGRREFTRQSINLLYSLKKRRQNEKKKLFTSRV
jgi:hypothetical protein